MSVTRISRSFKDISLSFVPHPVTKDIGVLRNENAIMRSVRNIIETSFTERFFNSIFGSAVKSTIFENADVDNANALESQIYYAIRNYEPRVTNINVFVNPEPDRNAYDITINYEIVGQDLPFQQFTFILEATR
jgi:phage baseplate assembly protein W